MNLNRNFSMGEYLKKKYENLRPKIQVPSFKSTNFTDWKTNFSEIVKDALGPFPENVPLNSERIQEIDKGDYIQKKIVFDSEADMSIPAYLLIPKDIKPNETRPGILAAHGHGNGKDDVCGVFHGEPARIETINMLNYTYAIQFVKKGFVVLAPDWRGFGERRLGYDFRSGPIAPKDGCDQVFLKGILMGINTFGLNIHHAFTSISYLQSLKEVNSDVIGCVGLSYGGTISLFTSALDDRIKGTIVSGYLNLLGDFAINQNFCGNQTPIGLLKHGDLPSVAALIAPKFLYIESGRQDYTFPIESSVFAYNEVKRVYKEIDAERNIHSEVFEGGHKWSGKYSVDLLTKYLNSII